MFSSPPETLEISPAPTNSCVFKISHLIFYHSFIGVHILGEIRPGWGGLIPWPNRDGRTELDRLSWSKKSTIPQSTVGGLFTFGESAVGRNGGPVCGDGNWGEYLTLKGGGRHGQLVTGQSISMGPPALTP